ASSWSLKVACLLSLWSVAGGRAGSEFSAGARHGSTQIVLEIQSLAFDDQRTVVHLRVNVANVFAEDAHKKKLQRPQKEHPDRDRCNADRELAPEKNLV